jgi:hypothetical protein
VKVTPEIARRFAQHCDWAEQCWHLRKYLFDDNPRMKDLFEPRHAHFFRRLSIALQEYWLHEVAKLHDPPKQAGRINLTIDYVFEFGTWDPSVKATLAGLKERLARLAQAVKVARNRLLSHNDLEITMSGESLGTFEDGDDVAYFEALREFANVVHTNIVGTPYLFDGLTKNDVEAFMADFGKKVA